MSSSRLGETSAHGRLLPISHARLPTNLSLSLTGSSLLDGVWQAIGPSPLRTASDTANVIYRDLADLDVHRVVNRWAAPIPRGTAATTAANPNWWREARGVRISSCTGLNTSRVGGCARAFTEDVRWIFDKEGKDEHLRRQVYSLQVTRLVTRGRRCPSPLTAADSLCR